MSDTNLGIPTTAQIILFTDGISTIFKNNRASFDTLLTNCQTYRGVVSTIGHASLEQACKLDVDQKVQDARYENYFKRDFRLIQDLSNILTEGLPGSMSFGTLLPINGWLTRINGNSGIPTPANPLVLTAATTNGGGLATASSGNAPRVCFTHVGTNDMYESLPSAESTQVALVGSQNSYTPAVTGNVPTGVTKLNIYRGLPGVATGTWYYDQTVLVTAGVSYNTYLSSVVIQQPDSFLAQTILPPSWISCLMTPEFAYEAALIMATMSMVGGTDTAPYVLTSQGMLSPTNVALGPSNGWIGRGNTVGSAQFGTRDLAGSYVAGSIQTSNVPGNSSQGFVGATNIQVRASTQLNGTYHPTISYTYIDATHTTPQTQTGVTPTADFVGGIANETKLFNVTAGRVVLSVSETGSSGTATTGVIVYEAQPVRSY